MHAPIILISFSLLHIVNAYPQTSPVHIVFGSVGASEGSRIDLSENYHPLSSAKATTDVKPIKSLSRAYAPRPFINAQPSLSLEKAEQIQAHSDSSYPSAGWLPWSDWSECVNGERIRYRSCIPTVHINCVGLKVEKEPCSLAEAVEIPFASDPWVIEREISFQGLDRATEPSK